MHDIRWIREHRREFARGLERRGMSDSEGLVEGLLSLDERRRAAIAEFEQAQARRNAASKEIGQAKAKKDDARAQALMAEVAELKDRIPALEKSAKGAESDLEQRLSEIPNVPADGVPDGADANDNVERHRSAPSAIMTSRPGSISTSARRSVRWILPPPPSSPVHASSC
jgi:seryl-tRNA synthetase